METINSKYLEQHRMKNSKYLMDLILCQIFETISSISSRSINYWLINHKFRYTSTKFKTELHSKLKLVCQTAAFCQYWKQEILPHVKFVTSVLEEMQWKYKNRKVIYWHLMPPKNFQPGTLSTGRNYYTLILCLFLLHSSLGVGSEVFYLSFPALKPVTETLENMLEVNNKNTRETSLT